jgi:hypothetical protein
MKHLFIFIFIVFVSITAFSQITIRRADYTVSGLTLDTSKFREIYISGLAIPQRGGNRVWDYTAIKDSTTSNNQANSPAVQATLTPEFKDATFFFRPRPTFGTYSIVDTQYLRLDTTGYFIMGYKRGKTDVNVQAQTGGATDTLSFLPRLTKFSTPPYLVKFPMTSTTISKVMTIDTVPYQLRWVSAGYATKANVSHIRRVEYTTEVIGWGTLRLRNSVIGRPNLEFGVLLERYAELRQDSFYLNDAPMPQRILDSFRLLQGKRDTSSIAYSLRGLGFKRGILYFKMSSDEAYILSANRVIEPKMSLESGTRDLVSNDVPLTIFPNPITEGVNFEFDKKTDGEWHIVIYNETGQMVDFQSVTSPRGVVKYSINLAKSLPSGTYFTQIMDESSLIRSTGRFVKM